MEGVYSFGDITDKVEQQIARRMVDLLEMETVARGMDIITKWVKSLNEEDRKAVLSALELWTSGQGDV